MTLLSTRWVAFFLFYLSGFAALVYQVAWQRLLVVFAGGDVLAITILVAAFMIGLGWGSLAGGVLADRLSPGGNLTVFGCVEGLIALFGWASKTLFYDVLYLRFGGLAGSRGMTAVVLVMALVIPTFLMGVSLPLLVRVLVRQLPEAAVKTGRLYGVNTLGAASGALVTTWVLMPLMGIEGSVRFAVVLNGVCALGVVPLLRGGWGRESGEGEAEVRVAGGEGGIRRWLVLFALSGFIALALEMVWFRLLGVMLKSTAVTLGTLLGIYLLGVGLGAMTGSMLAGRVRRASRGFLLVQWGVGLYAGLAVVGVFGVMEGWSGLGWVKAYLGSYEPIDANTAVMLLKEWWVGEWTPEGAERVWLFPMLHGVLPVVVMLPATWMMGLSYPLLQKAVQDDWGKVGRRVGWLQAANIGGSLLGAVMVSGMLLPGVGTAETLRLLVGLSGVFGVVAVVRGNGGWMMRGMVGLVVSGSVWMMPDGRTLWARAHGTVPEGLIVAEDGAGVSVLKKSTGGVEGAGTMVFVNGIGQSWIPFGGIHSALGALPALLHPKPESVAIIGLGSGDTLFSAAARQETKELVCVEIVGAAMETLREMAATSEYAGLRLLLGDERIRHETGDGRLHLMATEEHFDVIEADALRPTSAHSGHLYSEGYFKLMLSRLKRGGLAVTWAPTERVRDTFVAVFPHVVSVPPMLIGSNEAIAWDVPVLRRRMNDAVLRERFAVAGLDVLGLLVPVLSPEVPVTFYGPSFDRGELKALNTDLFPRDELELPGLWGPLGGG